LFLHHDKAPISDTLSSLLHSDKTINTVTKYYTMYTSYTPTFTSFTKLCLSILQLMFLLPLLYGHVETIRWAKKAKFGGTVVQETSRHNNMSLMKRLIFISDYFQTLHPLFPLLLKMLSFMANSFILSSILCYTKLR